MGNPGAFSYSHTLWVKGFLDALGSPHYYTAGSQDVNNRFAASALLYGSPLVVPIPDLPRTSFLFMVGANPLVSHGSVLSAPRVREQLLDVEARGGPGRRGRPARDRDRAPVRAPARPPGLRRLAAALDAPRDLRGAARGRGLPRRATPSGAEELRSGGRALTRPRRPRRAPGMPAERVRELARDFAKADGAAAYGRTGSCLGRFGTLVAFLLDALNAVTGNLDRPGGAVFGSPPIAIDDLGEKLGLGDLRQDPLALRRLPRRARQPARRAAAARDRDPGRAPGPGAVRLGRQSGPVRARRRLARAGARRARPARLARLLRERDQQARRLRAPDHDLLRARGRAGRAHGLLHDARSSRSPSRWCEPAGEARQEWEIIDDISRRVGHRALQPRRRSASAARLGVRPQPARPGGPAAAHRPQGRPVRPAARLA